MKDLAVVVSHWVFTRMWAGPRCDEFDPSCPVCIAWMEHDEIVHFLTEEN